MIKRTFSYWLWILSIGVLSLALAAAPLFNILAFEFCAVITLFIAFAGAHVAMTELQVMKRDPDKLAGASHNVILGCFYRALKSNGILLLIPLIIILLNSIRIKNCNFLEGFLFYLILPTLSCFTVTAAGIFFYLWIQRRWLAYLVYLTFLIVSCVPTISNLIFHPPVFAFHPILGYFPGPIYDFVISITPTLLISRTETILWGLVFIAISVFTCKVNRTTALIPKLRWQHLIKLSSQFSLLRITTISFMVLAIIGIELYSGKLGIRPSRQDIEQVLGGYRETDHFEIYFSRELDSEIALFADDCEFRYAQLSEYLQTENSRKVRAYLYASPTQKKRLIGAGDTFVEDPFGYGFHVHALGFPHPVLKHELAHVLTADWSPWKVSLNVGMHEGVAVAADWEEDKLTVHQWAKAMQALNVAPPLSSVMSLGFWKHAGSRSYLMAGSFVRFLIEKYGIEKCKQAFPIGNLPRVYEKDLNALEREWRLYLGNEVSLHKEELDYATQRLKRGGIFEQVCAHEMASLRQDAWRAYYRQDYSTAVESFQKMLSFEPQNTRNTRGLMYSTYYTGNFQSTIAIAKRIISDKNTQFRAEAAQVLGDIYWIQGKTEDALTTYQQAYTQVTRESIERKLVKRIAALSLSFSPESRNRLRRVLVPNSNLDRTANGTKMALLLRIIKTDPNIWLPYYLIGELLHKEEAWELSTQYLHHALDLGNGVEEMPMPQNIRTESLQVLGMNAFRKKDYTIAERIYTEIVVNKTLSLGEVHEAQVWVERCRWTAKKKP